MPCVSTRLLRGSLSPNVMKHWGHGFGGVWVHAGPCLPNRCTAEAWLMGHELNKLYLCLVLPLPCFRGLSSSREMIIAKLLHRSIPPTPKMCCDKCCAWSCMHTGRLTADWPSFLRSFQIAVATRINYLGYRVDFPPWCCARRGR